MNFKLIRFFNKRQQKFIFYGIVNVLITNCFLQLFLLFISTSLSTFLSQQINIFFGLNIYGKKVFKVERIKKRYIIRYLFIAYILWILNWLLIDKTSSIFLISKNFAAIIVLPFLAALSYFLQKYIVFRK